MTEPPPEPAASADDDEELSGLQWLSRERPEAMQHLLAFFRESGRHLDPKTRFLISVVTKVVRFSPRGLRQYIPRALHAGASRDEVLDAILCAYPAAGLTQVIDAVQVLRGLDLEDAGPAPPDPAASADSATAAPTAAPQNPEPAPQNPEWVTVGGADGLAPGAATAVTARGQRLALFNVDGTLHATANACLHQGGELGCSLLDGKVVTCNRHGWVFDVTSGECLTQPGRRVRSYPVRVAGQTVQVLV